MATKPTTLKRRALTARHEPEAREKRRDAPRFGQGRGGRPWRRLRDQVLLRDGYLCQCEECKAKDLPLPAHEVDHISNARDEADRLDDSLDNLRAVNRDCHRRITRQQQREAAQYATMSPAWLPTTAKPLTVVCGPPGSGKTTWVRERASHADLVIDLDYFARDVIGKMLWDATSQERAQVIRARNDLLAQFMRGKTAHPRCYLIDTAGSYKRRKFWSDRGAEVVVLETDKALCRLRVLGCTDRPARANRGRVEAIDRWE